MSFLVCFLYDFKAASEIAWNREESGAIVGAWDMGEAMTVEGSRMVCLLRVRVR